MKKLILLAVIITLLSCNLETPTQFSDKALNDSLITLDKSKITFKEVINQYKGKKILIDIWASWCADCIKGLPKIKELQKEFPEVIFLFLSVDKKETAWKKGIKRFRIEGEHYNLPKGMKKGDLVDFLNTSWIPRYIVLDKKGNIQLFKAIKASDRSIKVALQKTNTSF